MGGLGFCHGQSGCVGLYRDLHRLRLVQVVDIFLMSFCYVVSQTCFTFFIPLLLHDCFGYTPQGARKMTSQRFWPAAIGCWLVFLDAPVRHWDISHRYQHHCLDESGVHRVRLVVTGLIELTDSISLAMTKFTR